MIHIEYCLFNEIQFIDVELALKGFLANERDRHAAVARVEFIIGNIRLAVCHAFDPVDPRRVN